MNTRAQIIATAREIDKDMGDEAMIAEGEYGYWVGTTVYVSKADVRCGHRLAPSLPECTLPAGHADPWHRHHKASLHNTVLAQTDR